MGLSKLTEFLWLLWGLTSSKNSGSDAQTAERKKRATLSHCEQSKRRHRAQEANERDGHWFLESPPAVSHPFVLQPSVTKAITCSLCQPSVLVDELQVRFASQASIWSRLSKTKQAITLGIVLWLDSSHLSCEGVMNCAVWRDFYTACCSISRPLLYVTNPGVQPPEWVQAETVLHSWSELLAKLKYVTIPQAATSWLPVLDQEAAPLAVHNVETNSVEGCGVIMVTVYVTHPSDFREDRCADFERHLLMAFYENEQNRKWRFQLTFRDIRHVQSQICIFPDVVVLQCASLQNRGFSELDTVLEEHEWLAERFRSRRQTFILLTGLDKPGDFEHHLARCEPDVALLLRILAPRIAYSLGGGVSCWCKTPPVLAADTVLNLWTLATAFRDGKLVAFTPGPFAGVKVCGGLAWNDERVAMLMKHEGPRRSYLTIVGEQKAGDLEFVRQLHGSNLFLSVSDAHEKANKLRGSPVPHKSCALFAWSWWIFESAQPPHSPQRKVVMQTSCTFEDDGEYFVFTAGKFSVKFDAIGLGCRFRILNKLQAEKNKFDAQNK